MSSDINRRCVQLFKGKDVHSIDQLVCKLMEVEGHIPFDVTYQVVHCALMDVLSRKLNLMSPFHLAQCVWPGMKDMLWQPNCESACMGE